MSVVLATRYADRVELATDGGVWDASGILVERKDKLLVAPGSPLAVTGVGGDEELADVSRWVLGATLGCTVDGALAFLERTLPTRPEVASPVVWRLVIGAVSETRGPGIWMFRGLEKGDTALPMLKRHVLDYVAFGPSLTADEMRATGWSLTDFSSGLVDRFNLMRTKSEAGSPIDALGNTLPADHYVGCHIDHAVVSATGVTLHRIHEWPDEIGQRITP